MTDPAKLKLTARTGFARTLLESALEDHSAPGAAQRALLAVSVGAGVAAVAAASSASAATASASASIGGKWAGALILKWLGFGLLAGTTTLLSVDYVTRANHFVSVPNAAPRLTPAIAKSPTFAALPPAPTLPASAASDRVPPPQREFERMPSAAPARPSELRVERAPEPAPDPLAALQAIRSALAAHAPERALGLLDDFERHESGASLAEEATVLRIEALADAGRAEAATLGAAFLRQYPHSAYAQRVRSKLHLP